jgi:hypothetical protein
VRPVRRATTVVAILAVLGVVLSYRVGHRGSGDVSLANFSAVEARVDALSGQVAELQKSVKVLAKRSTRAPSSAAATKANKRLSTCLTQMQREIDDLQAYLAYRTPPRRDRVSGTCRALLTPRFAGR